jgi:hypothetical protein
MNYRIKQQLMRSVSFLLLSLSILAVSVSILQTASDADGQAAVKNVKISIDYVSTTQNEFNKVSKTSAADKDQYATLLASLVRSGSKHSKSPIITTHADCAGEAAIHSYVPVTTTKNGTVEKSVLDIGSTASVRPHLNPDGTITAILLLQQSDLDSDNMSVVSNKINTVATFTDGQTIMFVGDQADAKSSNPVERLYFVRIESSR